MIVAVVLICAWVGMTVVSLVGLALVTLWRGAQWLWDVVMWKRDVHRMVEVLDRFEAEPLRRKAEHLGALARTLDQILALPEQDVVTLAKRWL